jgi:DNA-binding transcriptional LysR family regulator
MEQYSQDNAFLSKGKVSIMNDRQLKYILTIAEEGNITTAAQKLYISQPSLSSLLANVENELGIKLFDRSISRISLTYAGECFVEAAKRILSIKAELEHQIEDIQDCQKGRLSIGCGRQLSSILFPRIIPAFRSKYPGFTVKLIEESLPVLHNMLSSGDLDIAFTYVDINNKKLECVPLFDEEMILMAPTSFKPSVVIKKDGHKFPLVEFSDFDEKPFVLFKTGHNLRVIIDKIFADFGIHPNIILETDNWQTCIGMVTMGEAFTILPYSSIMGSDSDGLNRYSIDGNYYRHMYIYYHKNIYLPKIIEEFINLAQIIINNV